MGRSKGLEQSRKWVLAFHELNVALVTEWVNLISWRLYLTLGSGLNDQFFELFESNIVELDFFLFFAQY